MANQRLIGTILKTNARLVEVVAPAGYGKTALAAAAGEAIGAFKFLHAGNFEAALEQHRGKPFLLILDDVEEIPDDRIASIASAIDTAQLPCRVMLCSRRETALHRALTLHPHERLVLRSHELALREHEVFKLFERFDVPESVVRQISEISEGWPVAVLSLRHAVSDAPEIRNVKDILSGSAVARLFDYLYENVVRALDMQQRHALVLCAGLPGLTPAQAKTALSGNDCVHDLIDLQLAARDSGGGVRLRSLLQVCVQNRLCADLQESLASAATAFEESGNLLYASAAHFRAGDYPNAAAKLHALGSTPKALTAYPYRLLWDNAVEELERASLRSYPELWLAFILWRRHTEPPEVLLRDALDMLSLQGDSIANELHNALLAVAAILTTDAGRPNFGYDLIARAKPTANPESDDALMLQCATALLDAHTGQPGSTEAWARVRKHFWGYDAWFTMMMRLEILGARNSGSSAAAFSIISRMLAVAQRSGSLPIEAHVLLLAVFTAWLYGDDTRLSRYVSETRRVLQKINAPGMSGMLDAFKGVLSEALRDYPSGRAWAMLIVATAQDLTQAKKTLEQAREWADYTGDATLRAMTRLAIARLTRSPMPASSNLENVSAAFEPFLRRYDRLNGDETHSQGPAIRIEVATGRVCKDGKPQKISFKTLELLIALAVEARPLAKEILLERLWPEQPSASAQNTLKMLVHRARQHIGDPQLVVVKNGMYELGRHVATDVRVMRGIRNTPHTRLEEATELLEVLLEGRPSAFAAWDWFAPFEQQLLGITADLGVALGREALQSGNIDRALFYSQALVQLDPCDEAATELLIRAHLARGERHLAISKYRRFARSLKRELDAQPSFSVEDLMRLSING